MKLVTGTYSFFIHIVSCAALASSARRLSAAAFPFTAIRSEGAFVDVESVGALVFTTRALSGLPLNVCFLNFFSSNSRPSRFALRRASSRSFCAWFSFCEAIANLRASISSLLIFTFLLNPRLNLCVRNTCRLLLRFQLRSSTVGISLVA